MEKNTPIKLLKKYNQPGPRYTSYPTYPSWTGIKSELWFEEFQKSLNENPTLSLYIHVPFCKTLCAFCGCTKMITKDYSKADEYIKALHREFNFYENMIPDGTKISEIHLGGGSPSWLKPEELKTLLAPILNSKKLIIDRNILEQSIEMDPRTTSVDHCEQLQSLGFNRVSLGIQDTNDTVLKSIRREQPLSLVTDVVTNLKAHGIKLLNMDLIYGLPFQTTETIKKTVEDIINFKPTRIALYSYAHVPSMKPAQKLLERDGLPNAEEKMQIAEVARELLINAGYEEIGMDHFALKTDSLYHSFEKGELHRNFMGYTVQRSQVLLGLGPSSLSDSWTAFSQNEKDYKAWLELINLNGHAIIHGHKLSHHELLRRKEILNLMCEFSTKINTNKLTAAQVESLKMLSEDDLIKTNDDEIIVTQNGKHFIRNICMAIDDSLDKTQTKVQFSQTV
jgi:oxygen-independent coproporphyrinogen-3 oxidase